MIRKHKTLYLAKKDDIALAKIEGIRMFCESKLEMYREIFKSQGRILNEDSHFAICLKDGIVFADKLELKIRRNK